MVEDETKQRDAKGKWVTYRPDIKVLDCTIRDGGLMNNSHFDDELVRAVYEANVEAGVDYMELGYKSSKRLYPPDEYGPWKHCDEETIRRVVGDNDSPMKLAVMADAERTDYHEDIIPASESVIDMVRVATYIHQIPTAIDMIVDAHEKGYETTCNLMAVSAVQERDLEDAIIELAKSPVNTIYLVDSFGALYSEQIQDLTRMYLKHAEPAGKTVGIHTHNNQQLAYANTIEALILGASMLDGSFAGLGRGAGNCPIELLIGFLHNPKFRLRPVLKCIQEYIAPLKEELRWGFDIPYMLTGQLNQHPRAAMKFMASDERLDIVKFYDDLMEEE